MASLLSSGGFKHASVVLRDNDYEYVVAKSQLDRSSGKYALTVSWVCHLWAL
jgi:hypothetical protein